MGRAVFDFLSEMETAPGEKSPAGSKAAWRKAIRGDLSDCAKCQKGGNASSTGRKKAARGTQRGVPDTLFYPLIRIIEGNLGKLPEYNIAAAHLW